VDDLNEDETAIVELVRAFVDQEVRPVRHRGMGPDRMSEEKHASI
jgi:hypothetical protein